MVGVEKQSMKQRKVEPTIPPLYLQLNKQLVHAQVSRKLG